MKNLLKFNKEKVKAISIFVILILFAFGFTNSYATEFEAEFSNDYLEWVSNDDKNIYDMPRAYAIDIPEDVLNEISKPSITSILENRNQNVLRLHPVSAVSTDARFNLADVIDVRVKNQMLTSECWAFALMSSLESNNLIRLGKTENYSERHMDYSTAQSFIDGENPFAFDRKVGAGGLSSVGLAYLTNGQGAVLEEDMPFENNEDEISIKEIDKTVSRVVCDYEILPTIFKRIDSEGNISYSDALGNPYTEEQVDSIRDYIKAAIIEHGAVASVTAGSKNKYYNNPENPMLATAYFCNDNYVIRDHAITIVGWDDNYSRENFNEACRPKEDGAYIILNSYGVDAFEKGFMYVSYEDILIETDLYVIQNSKDKTYDNIYQHDALGGMFAIGTASQDEGYYAVTFERDVEVEEKINRVGITVEDYVNVEIYVNPNSADLSKENLVFVGSTTSYLEPGYHEIGFNDVELTGEEYAVVIKQYSKTDKFYVTIETSCANSVYSNVKSSERSFVSFDGLDWEKVNEMVIPGLEMQNSDVCIKAFTNVSQKEKITLESQLYKIEFDKVFKIEYNTNKLDFLSNVNSDYRITILDEEGNDVTNLDEEPIIRTGMKLKLDTGNEYTLVVRGDINCDGNITLTDLSKLILEYNETTGFRLDGVSLDGADLNCDGKITLTDVSQLLVIYTEI